MWRQILIVLFGVVLSYFMIVTSGYIIYRIDLPTGWSEPRLGALVRYLFDPLIVIVIGSIVGALAKKQAGLLAALSVLPFAAVIPL